MKRWLLSLLTLLFTLGVLGAPGALAQTKTQPPAKTETKLAAAQAAPAPEKKALLDLNTASADELKALPGMEELVQKKILPKAIYDKIKDQIHRKAGASEKVAWA